MPNNQGDGVIWDYDTTQKLKALWAQGFSFSKIAEQIPGATRGTIAGKRYRLKLPSRKCTVRAPRKSKYA